jgi:PRTRC genetic system protein C
MALNITTAVRVFVIEETGVEIPDPDPKLSLENVMALYSGMYPELTTATIHGPEYRDDKVVYRFKSVIGTKG